MGGNTSLIATTVTIPGGGGASCSPATVAFVIDGSGSMCEPFGTGTRWQELRNALLDKTQGLIYRVQDRASFGLFLYDGSIDFELSASAASGPPATCNSPNTGRRLRGTECLQLIEVQPKINNAPAIDQMYPTTELGGSTPTDKAMNRVVDQLLTLKAGSADPQYIILATDGQPNDICIGGAGGDGLAQQQGVIAAVDRAASMGITTFVISLASDPALQMHLDEVARHGDKANPAARTFSPTSTNDLVTTLTNLLGQAIGCPI